MAVSDTYASAHMAVLTYTERRYIIRFYRVPMMVYNTHNYCVFGFCPLSSIQNSREQNLLETAFVSVLR
jgi:hypothetical protein